MSRHRFHPAVRLTQRDWAITLLVTAVAVAGVVVGTALGRFHGPAAHQRVIAWLSAVVVLVAGVWAVRHLATGISHLVTPRESQAAKAIARLVFTGFGYLLTLLAVFGVLGVSLGQVLLGAGIAGIVLGIAAQQSLGNIFASLVLIFARPFVVGDDIRIRSGALGGIFDAKVLGLDLTYVTLQTEDGIVRIPNSAMLAAGIGQLRAPAPVPPVRSADDTQTFPDAR